MKRFSVLGVLIAVGLSGCLPEERMSVTPLPDGRIEFKAHQAGTGSDDKCFASLAIFEVVGTGEGAVRNSSPSWEVVSRATCVDTLFYPDVPEGFQPTQLAGLKPGRTYDAIARINEGLVSMGFTNNP